MHLSEMSDRKDFFSSLKFTSLNLYTCLTLGKCVFLMKSLGLVIINHMHKFFIVLGP